MNKFLQLFIIFFLSLMFFSCNEEIADALLTNQPPDTFLFLYPDSIISQQPSRLKVSWWGDDKDGLVIGFYFKWEGIDSAWTFTPFNDSTFSLPIGSTDTSYNFLVASADNEGNGVYDSQVNQNGINFGSEPFVDQNMDGTFNQGEKFFDIGLIDPTPASTKFPILNSTPEISWNELTILPDTSFPVMTLAWNADDLDGTETIVKINIALNDTTSFVSLNGGARLITIRTNPAVAGQNPELEILLNGSDQNIFPDKLKGIKLDDQNKIYVQAEDISGAKSSFISIPDSGNTWFVKKPNGKVLIVDNFQVSNQSANTEAANFYNQSFSSIAGGSLAGKFEVFDMQNSALPFENVTLLETLKLFEFVFWYSTSKPRLDLLNLVTNKFREANGKIAISLTLEDSSSSFPFDLSSLQGFLPIDSVGKKVQQGFLLSGADVVPSSQVMNYPPLKTSATISFVRVFEPNGINAEKVYELSSTQLNGNISFRTTDKTLFFIGLPLHQCNGGFANVEELLEKIFIEDFGLIP